MKLCEHAIIRRIHAHRADDDAVVERHPADLEGVEEGGDLQISCSMFLIATCFLLILNLLMDSKVSERCPLCLHLPSFASVPFRFMK